MSSLKNQIMLTKYQTKVLEILANKIESSKTYAGTNLTKQSFYCKPSEILIDYYSDYADLEEIEKLNSDMNELKKLGIIKLTCKNNEIIKIKGIFEEYNAYCKLLGRKEKKEELEDYRRLFMDYLGLTPTLDNYCKKQLEMLDQNRKTSAMIGIEELKKLLECIKYIETNDNEIMERELSIELFSDSKTFENSYRGRVCTIMKNYGNYEAVLVGETEAKMINNLILSANCIVHNPTYIYFKGNGTLYYKDGISIALSNCHTIAVNSQDIPNILKISLDTEYVMTVENLTSFNRVYSDNVFFVYLSGYNNNAKARFLKQLNKDNAIKKWFHFGDIDPDGFCILEHLKNSSGIELHPYNMGVDELIKYSRYSKDLEKQDAVKAGSLLSQNKYSEVLEYLINNKCKLEQEIISWKESTIII